MSFFFFFQAEDGIRDYKVTGVQTCALPIWLEQRADLRDLRVQRAVDLGLARLHEGLGDGAERFVRERGEGQIGRASCREREERSGVAGVGKRSRKRRRRKENVAEENNHTGI